MLVVNEVLPLVQMVNWIVLENLLTCFPGCHSHVVPVAGLPVQSSGHSNGPVTRVYSESFCGAAPLVDGIAGRQITDKVVFWGKQNTVIPQGDSLVTTALLFMSKRVDRYPTKT